MNKAEYKFPTEEKDTLPVYCANNNNTLFIFHSILRFEKS